MKIEAKNTTKMYVCVVEDPSCIIYYRTRNNNNTLSPYYYVGGGGWTDDFTKAKFYTKTGPARGAIKHFNYRNSMLPQRPQLIEGFNWTLWEVNVELLQPIQPK